MRIIGGKPLNGEITISGAKNLALPALVAALLSDSEIILRNVPKLADINSLLGLLEFLGCDINYLDDHSISLKTDKIKSTEAPYDFVRKMRASILVLGPLVSRFKKASVSLPGGCAIGARGVDLHIKALELMGAQISIENGYIKAQAEKGLFGCDITFPIVTVTGTENALMAAVLAKGTTRVTNAAMEPEVIAFCNLLNKMGAKIAGHGTPIITIEGVESLRGTKFEIIPDRIETGTYAIAAALTNGKLLLKNCVYDDLFTFFEALQSAGIACEKDGLNNVLVYRKEGEIRPVDIQTAPYPGFPTDLQAQYSVLMSICSGTATVTENIFENRFMHVPELNRMGANIAIHGKTVVITAVKKLFGAQVMATDLRASVSLILAGLVADGETVVNRIYHLDRGYENIDKKLTECGANIERFSV
ncbi:MAG: UDP-N-acetylglucosamine 1-carboxyvinyltransferase [Holosporales bacterium]|jgi:UDP-N-acetylglucosamine 1-carboxyvinyltransferase|nr:UDP-N-acetylglucosamine 1-carboxyvinyltransferase [Holosporales bacterium]